MSGGRKAIRAAVLDERDVARFWWSLPVWTPLPLTNGETWHVIFPGFPGGGPGPDVRDAVLSPFISDSSLSNSLYGQEQCSTRIVGDVEFHIHTSDWRAHSHATDPRYNSVVLHMVMICDDPKPTLRQDGHSVPVCSLHDVPRLTSLPITRVGREAGRPCREVMRRLGEEERCRLLTHAGILRFEQKTAAFVEQLHCALPGQHYDLYDTCFVPALAEALAYGRDREFFRAVGQRLLEERDGRITLPEPLGRTEEPAPLDAQRLRVLARLVERWCIPGIWLTVRALLLQSYSTDVLYPGNVLQELRNAFSQLGLSLARTDILICNVVLPFAAAVGLLEQEQRLVQCAQDVYRCHPGLPSNRVTRMLSAQLQLAAEPHTACQQQGLHYVYQQTCREKRCNICLLGKSDI